MIYSVAKKLQLVMQALLLTLAVSVCQNGLAQPAQTPSEPELKTLQVNVNEADAETIADLLVGIGQSRAKAIVQYREEHGPYSSLEDLVKVTGVGEATVKNNSARIRFD